MKKKLFTAMAIMVLAAAGIAGCAVSKGSTDDAAGTVATPVEDGVLNGGLFGEPNEDSSVDNPDSDRDPVTTDSGGSSAKDIGSTDPVEIVSKVALEKGFKVSTGEPVYELIKARGGSGEYEWAAEGLSAGMELKKHGKTGAEFSGRTKLPDRYEIKISVWDLNDKTNGDEVSFLLEVGEMEKQGSNGVKLAKTYDPCGNWLEIEVVTDKGNLKVDPDSQEAVVLLDGDIDSLKVRAVGGEGHHKWTVESRVDESCHGEWLTQENSDSDFSAPPITSNLIPQIYYEFYDDYRCEEELQGTTNLKDPTFMVQYQGFTRNPTWECKENCFEGASGANAGDSNPPYDFPPEVEHPKAEKSLRFTTTGNELTLGGRIAYDGPLPVSKFVDEQGRDDLSRLPVERLTIRVQDRCGDSRPESFMNIYLKIKYPESEPVKDLKMDLVYEKKSHGKKKYALYDSVLFSFESTHKLDGPIAELEKFLYYQPNKCPDGNSGYCVLEHALYGHEENDEIVFNQVDRLTYWSTHGGYWQATGEPGDRDTGWHGGKLEIIESTYRTKYWYGHFDNVADRMMLPGIGFMGHTFTRENGTGFQNTEEGYFRRQPWPEYRQERVGDTKNLDDEQRGNMTEGEVEND